MQQGINVMGVLSAAVGLGAAGRSTLQVLDRRAIPYAVVDFDLGAGAASEPIPGSTPRASSLASLPYSTTVVHLNPDMFESMVLRWERRLGYDMAATVNAIVPFWELPALPHVWLPTLAGFDVLLAPTKFIRGALERGLTGERRPVVWDYPQAVQAPVSFVPDRARWLGARASCTTFFSTFDILSEIERKNPWAAIRAFQQAFPGRDDVTLVIKVNHARSSKHTERFAALAQLAADDPRVILMMDSLSRVDLWELYASTDVFVSLHRAEGLGLGLMEAMAVGKPTIATAWSGNMDFCTDANCMLVPYRMVPVSAVHPNYRGERSQNWADPDADAAASAMRVLADTPGLIERMGGQGRADMRARVEVQCRHGVFDDLIDLSEGATASSSAHFARVAVARRHALTRRAAPSNLWESAKRTGVRALRGLGLKPPPPADELQFGPPRMLS